MTTVVATVGVVLGLIAIHSWADWRKPAVSAAALLGGFGLLVLSGTHLSVTAITSIIGAS